MTEQQTPQTTSAQPATPSSPPAQQTPPVSDTPKGGTPPATPEGAKQRPSLLADPASSGEPKPQAEQKPQGAPERYELKAPEGIQFDAETMKVYEAAARKGNVTQDAAQGLLDAVLPVLQARQDAQINQSIEAARERELAALRADKEFGGERLAETVADAKKAIARFGDQELAALLNGPTGDIAAIVRMLARVARATSGDSRLVTRAAEDAAGKTVRPDSDEALYERYPTMRPKQAS